jgi:hypothetical protein
VWYRSSKLLFVLAFVFGGVIMWIDTTAMWGGSGLSCWLIFGASLALGFVNPLRGWLLSLAVAGWIALLGLINGNPPALFALVIGLGGSFVGAYARRLVASIARE